MKVGMYYNNRDVRLEELPKPSIGKGELLVKIQASGICGSDVMEWYRIKNAPLVLGHEVAGVIEEAGEEMNSFQQGDRVVVTHHVPCNTCRYCLNGHHSTCETLRTTNFDPGGFAEFVRVPKINTERGVFPLPKNVSFEEGSFIEPLATVVRGQRLAQLKPGQTVLVLGSGISGVMHIQLAKALGAGTIIATDVEEFRLDFAKQFGADETIKATENVPEKIKELHGRKADVVIVCTGATSAAEQAFHAVDRGGTILFFAVPPPDKIVNIPLNELWKNEVKVLTTYGGPPQDMHTALELIRTGKVDVEEMITHRLPLERIQEGFRLMTEGKESLKVIIQPHG